MTSSPCPGHTHHHEDANLLSQQNKNPVPKDYISTEFYIQEMDCPTEAALITKKLASVEQIHDINFNFVQRYVTIIYHPTQLDSILEALRQLGMTAIIKTQETPTVNHKKPFIKVTLATALALCAELAHWLTFSDYWVILLSLLALLLTGLQTYKKGWIALKNKTLNINALMSIAVTGALFLQQWPEAAMVMALFSLSELLEARSLERVKRSIASLQQLLPQQATVLSPNNEWINTLLADVKLGDKIQVNPGERVPLDGIILHGASSLNQATITGESIPVEKTINDTVLAGSINELGSLEIQVTSTLQHSTLTKIIQSIETAQSTRAPTQRTIDRFAQFYTPLVCLLALLVAIITPFVLEQSWQEGLYKGLVLLVIACPCALIISTPVTIISGLNAAARQGILIKGGIFLEKAKSIHFLAFDKTGTLTQGSPTLINYQVFSNDIWDKATILSIAKSLSLHSAHPLSRCISQAQVLSSIDIVEVQSITTILGRGLQGTYNLTPFYLGNHPLLKEKNIKLNQHQQQALNDLEQQGYTVSLLANTNTVLALFAMADPIKQDSQQAIHSLHQLGVKTLMLTGDNVNVANHVAQQLHIDRVHSALLPEQKLEIIDQLTQQGVVGMVGDGINDAPALARADISFAMGIKGSDTATETADVTLMNDNLTGLTSLIHLSKKTHRILVQNISFTLFIKVLFIGLSVFGLSNMWIAIFADVGASLLVISNGLRLLKAPTQKVSNA